MSRKKITIRDLVKNDPIKYGILFPIASIILGIALIYLTCDYQAKNKAIANLKNNLEAKVEMIADINSNGLDFKEMSEVYEKIGLNPIDELKRRGFKLTIEEMQKYLEKTGNFNPKTDAYTFQRWWLK